MSQPWGTAQNKWIGLKTTANCSGPSPSVGHSCTYVPSGEPKDNGRIYLIGGANQYGVCNHVHVFNLNSFTWTTLQSSGFNARYEHTAFAPSSQPNKVFVFGGANESGNSLPFQFYDITNNSWHNVDAVGPSPPVRTFHNGAIFYDDSLIVFGGGDLGSNPVKDDKVYIYNASTNAWKILKTKGITPELRLGHAMLVVGDVLYMHGGMVGTSLFDDLFLLDINSGTWSQPVVSGDIPSARAGHLMFKNLDDDVYTFGGMTLNGASNELYKLTFKSMKWSLIKSYEPSSGPSKRFDLACTTLPLDNFHVDTCNLSNDIVDDDGNNNNDNNINNNNNNNSNNSNNNNINNNDIAGIDNNSNNNNNNNNNINGNNNNNNNSNCSLNTNSVSAIFNISSNNVSTSSNVVGSHGDRLFVFINGGMNEKGEMYNDSYCMSI